MSALPSTHRKRSTRRNPRPPSGGPLEWAGPEAASLQEVTPLLALAWTRSAWLLMCNEKYPEPVFDETLTKRKPSKVIANDFLPRQVSIVANFRHFVGRSKRYHDDSETRPTKKRKIRGADSPSSMSLVNAETPLADCTESRMAAYAGPLTYLTPVLSDVALHGSLGDTDCEEYACMEAGAQSLHEEMTLVKSVERVAFGDAVVDTWYFSPYPRKVQPVETLFVCEWCLDYFKFKLEFLYHQKHCSAQHPPGNEIFRMDKWASGQQLTQTLAVRGRWRQVSAILPQPVLLRKAILRSQDSAVRHGAVPFLLPDGGESTRMPSRGLLLQGESQRHGIQPQLHRHLAPPSTEELRKDSANHVIHVIAL